MFSVLLLATLSALAHADRGTGESEARHIVRRLQTRKLTFRWEERTLSEAAADLSTWLDLPLVVAPALADREEDILTLGLTQAPALTVLRFMQDALDVRFLLDHGLILITTPQDTVRRTAVLRIYDIRSILYVPPDFRGPEIGLRPSGHLDEEDEVETPEGWDEGELVDLLRRGTGAASWEYDGVSIDSLRGRLVVRHTPSVHRQVQQMLMRLEAR